MHVILDNLQLLFPATISLKLLPHSLRNPAPLEDGEVVQMWHQSYLEILGENLQNLEKIMNTHIHAIVKNKTDRGA